MDDELTKPAGATMGWIICGGIVTAYFIGLTCLFADLASAPIMDTEKDAENGSLLHGSTDDDTEGTKDGQFFLDDLRGMADVDQYQQQAELIGGGAFDGQVVPVVPGQLSVGAYRIESGRPVWYRYMRTDQTNEGRVLFRFAKMTRNNQQAKQHN